MPDLQIVNGMLVATDTQEVIIDQMDLESIDQEITAVHGAIADIDNFKQRRLNNLNDRLEALQMYRDFLTSQ